MGWASSRPNNSHLTTPTWALAMAGIVLLNIALLMSFSALGPLTCTAPPGAPPGPGMGLSCDPGVTSEERARVMRLAVIGISLVLAGFVLGTLELVTRVVRNMRTDDAQAPRTESRRD